jgi:hypothetical protein
MWSISVGVALKCIIIFSITHNSLLVRMFIVWQLGSVWYTFEKELCLKTWLYIWVTTDLATLWHLKLKTCKTIIESRKQKKKCFGNILKEKSAVYRNIQQIKANYLIGRIEDKVRAPWMGFIECLQKYCQVYRCIILYVLQCATELCKIVFNIDKVD